MILPKSAQKSSEVRGHSTKANSLSLQLIAKETAKLWRKHHLNYDQTKHVVEQARILAGYDDQNPPDRLNLTDF